MARTETELDTLWQEFHDAVNMTSPELREWLSAEPVWGDAYPPEPGVDLRELGQGVLRVLGKRRTDVTDADTEVMRQVTELVRTRLAQPPPAGVNDEPWRHSLMTVGHDPLKAA